MMIDPNSIRRLLAELGNRDWPETWSQRETEEIGDFFGWMHRYKLNDPLTEAQVVQFEQKHGINLPEDYRTFLVEVGNGGAGPDYGINSLGSDEQGPLRESILNNLKCWFLHQDAWNGLFDEDYTVFEHPEYDEEQYFSDDIMRGAMPVSTKGCATDYWIVVSGPAKGQIWLDDRGDGNGIEPILDEEDEPITFGSWYCNWLSDAVRKWTLN